MFEQFSNSAAAKWVALAIAALIVAALIFQAGVAMGSRRIFERHGGMPGEHLLFNALGIPLPHNFVPHGGHGAVGTIAAVGTSTLGVTGPDGQTQTVGVDPRTIIETPDGTTTLSGLAAGARVIVIGEPDTAGTRINASLIRVLPN